MAAIKNVAIVGVSRYSLFEFSVEEIANLGGHRQGAGSLGVLVVDALVRIHRHCRQTPVLHSSLSSLGIACCIIMRIDSSGTLILLSVR